jgi:hypothetical protein
MQNMFLSNWVRQLRYKAKNRNAVVDITIDDVKTALEQHKNECIYCGSSETSPDLAFNLKDNSPAVAANVVPTCKQCRGIKKFNDILWMYINGFMPREKYVEALRVICALDTKGLLTERIKSGLK